MEVSKERIFIRDNKLTNELRLKCSQIVSKVKTMQLKDRRLHYEELSSLLSELLKNKNQNFEKETNELLKDNCFYNVEIVSILDDETEHFIDEIFKILTNKID